jgi:hypothetical protein
MFNLLVQTGSWSGNHDTMHSTRILTSASYTAEHLQAQYAPGGRVNFEALADLPTLFAEETFEPKIQQQLARIGRVHRCSPGVNGMIEIEYAFDSALPPIPQSELIAMMPVLGISPAGKAGWDELRTTHWAVKQIDLFKELYVRAKQTPRIPTLFNLPEPRRTDPNQLSVMMPFNAKFGVVYDAIERAGKQAGMNCHRADKVWEHSLIIQDIVALIDRSAIVVCDCTDRNANVFYEIGLAHSLNKHVIMITQQPGEIPFDLTPHRYIHYYPNGEGLQDLERELSGRIQTLRNPWRNRN